MHSTFPAYFNDRLAECPWKDCFWETAPIPDASSLSTPFECVLLNAHGMLSARRTSHAAFDEHLDTATSSDGVVTFPNLGRDAMLVVPARQSRVQMSVYGSLAPFVRGAPAEQRASLWRATSRAVREQLEAQPLQPVWVSTAGQGVPWLHVRLDLSGPKYYNHEPYKHLPAPASSPGLSATPSKDAGGKAAAGGRDQPESHSAAQAGVGFYEHE